MDYHIPCSAAIKIREDHESGFYTTGELAKIYNVSASAVHLIINGKSHQDCADHTEPGVPKTLGQFLAGE